jgi:hypothetical protein
MNRPRLSNNQKIMLQVMKECDGMEVHRDNWEAMRDLVKRGLAVWVIIEARGPDKAWRRAKLKEN